MVQLLGILGALLHPSVVMVAFLYGPRGFETVPCIASPPPPALQAYPASEVHALLCQGMRDPSLAVGRGHHAVAWRPFDGRMPL